MPSARDFGLAFVLLPPGPLNAITDVEGVTVGHRTLSGGGSATGVTAVLPHGGDLFRRKVRAGVEVINGFGKSVGLMQVAELATVETPILLTNTFSVAACAEALIGRAIAANPDIGRRTSTVNPLVFECNDGAINDIQAMAVTAADAGAALQDAEGGAVPQGAVGAGAGMTAFGFKAGIGTATVAPAAFAGTGLTEVALRDPHFLAVSDEADVTNRCVLANIAVSSGERNLSYCYERLLDKTGHAHGVDSPQWRDALVWVDGLARALRERLPEEVRLIITADHGMVDIDPGSCVMADDEPELVADVHAIAGEARFRHLMTTRGTADQVAQRWRDRLGEAAWVLTRDEAIEAGWFGAVATRFRDRFGDVVVAMANDGAILSRKYPGELRLIGMHGSMTSAEMSVPLLID